MAIYVNFKRSRSVKEFITLLYSYHNGSYLTSVETYSDKECTVVQCKKGKYRSIDEILEILQTYYPSLSIKKLIKSLYNTKIIKDEDNKEYTFHSLHCFQIVKTTTLFTPFPGNGCGGIKGISLYSPDQLNEIANS
jgi:hypothetical protein